MASPNWHWKSKMVTPWAKDWFQRELKLVINDEQGKSVSITDVQCVDGDVELGQRKSKLIAIYDVHLKLTWSGKAQDGTDVSGTLDIPEVSHEITLDQLHDYVYNWECSTTTTEDVASLYNFARERLPTALESKFAEFPTVLMSVHGKDITVSAPTSQEPSRATTPALQGSVPAEKAVTRVPKQDNATNTSSVSVEASFMAPASELFSMLTDETRIPLWSRNSAISNPTAGSSFTLFGGNVKGVYSSVSPPKNFVQTWTLQNTSWPSGHFATLTTTFDQGNDSTKVTWSMVGVPVGMEDEIKRNLQGYYIGGLNSIGCVVVPTPASYPTSPASPVLSTGGKQVGQRPITALAIAILVLLAAFTLPYFVS